MPHISILQWGSAYLVLSFVIVLLTYIPVSDPTRTSYYGHLDYIHFSLAYVNYAPHCLYCRPIQQSYLSVCLILGSQCSWLPLYGQLGSRCFAFKTSPGSSKMVKIWQKHFLRPSDGHLPNIFRSVAKNVVQIHIKPMPNPRCTYVNMTCERPCKAR